MSVYGVEVHMFMKVHMYMCVCLQVDTRDQVSFLRAIRLGGFFLFLKIICMSGLLTCMYVQYMHVCYLQKSEGIA